MHTVALCCCKEVVFSTQNTNIKNIKHLISSTSIICILCLLLGRIWGCQLSEVHVNQLTPDTFERTLEQQADDWELTITGAIKTPIGGVAIIGTKTIPECQEDPAIGYQMELDRQGIIQNITDLSLSFPLEFCKNNYIIPSDVVLTSRDAYALCGTQILNNTRQFYVSLGTKTYTKESSTGQGNALVATADGGLIVAGDIKEADSWVALLIRFNADLEVVWENSWKDPTPIDRLDNITGATDIVFSGSSGFSTLLNGSIIADYKLGTYNESNGQPTSLSPIPLNSGNSSFAEVLLAQLTDGSFIISSGNNFLALSGTNFSVTALGSTGTKIWETSLYPVFINDLQPTPDGGFLIVGTTISNAPSNAILIKIDANGQEEWQREYGGNLDDEGHQVVLMNDGGYLLIGIERSISNKDGALDKKGIYLVKTDQNGEVN